MLPSPARLSKLTARRSSGALLHASNAAKREDMNEFRSRCLSTEEASTLQARVAHVGHPIVFKLLLRHFAVTIRVKDHKYSGCIVPRHRHPQVLQKFYELSNVNKSRSVFVEHSERAAGHLLLLGNGKAAR